MGDVVIRVRVTPRGGRDAVTASPATGRCTCASRRRRRTGSPTRACVELLAGALGVNRAAVVLAGGATFRDKRFR
jgi:uncharacterized protein YggU (UPF0235/DUF167 family)